MALYIINVLAVIFVLAGFHLAFRQKTVRALTARVRSLSDRSPVRRGADVGNLPSEEVASVLRIAGVMIMAFSFTAGAFANLIAYYTAGPG